MICSKCSDAISIYYVTLKKLEKSEKTLEMNGVDILFRPKVNPNPSWGVTGSSNSPNQEKEKKRNQKKKVVKKVQPIKQYFCREGQCTKEYVRHGDYLLHLKKEHHIICRKRTTSSSSNSSNNGISSDDSSPKRKKTRKPQTKTDLYEVISSESEDNP